MENAALRGNPDAANPYVRFDEGEVAPVCTAEASLRRVPCRRQLEGAQAGAQRRGVGPLHHNRVFARFSSAAAAALLAAFAAQGETYYYVGDEPYTNTSWNTAALWATADGTTASASPASDDTIVFTNSQSVGFSGAATIQCEIVKRGVGEVAFNGNLTLYRTLTLERGRFYHANKTLTLMDDFAIVAKGAESKIFYLNDGGNNSHLSVTIPSYSETADASGMTFSAYGAKVFTTTFKGDAGTTTRFSADISCNTHNNMYYTFDWNPDEAATLEIVNRVYDKRANEKAGLRASRGTMRFTEGAGVTRLPGGIEVKSGATLEITASAASDTFGCPVVIEEGGKLKLSRGQFKPTSLTYDGVALAEGRYSRASGYDWIEDDGILVIGTGALPAEPATTTATWTGNGGNTSVLNPANWGAADNETLPDLTDGSLVAAFPAGAEASVPAGTTVAFKGIVVSASPFTIAGGAGSVMKLGSEGVSVSGAAFTNACPTVITHSQTWSVAADCEFALAAEVFADWPTVDTLTLSGAGEFDFRASNPDLCNVAYGATVHARADNALGGARVTATATAEEKVVMCHGVSFANRFTTSINNWQNTDYNLFTICSGVNTFNGEVESAHSNGHYWRFADDADGAAATAVFRGGYRFSAPGNAQAAFSPYYNGTMTVENVPMDICRMYVGWARFYSQILNLNVASNKTTRGIHILRYSTLNTTVPYALYATDDGQSGVQLNDGAAWNLSADQGVNVFAGITNTATVASDNGATLHLRDDRLNTVYMEERSQETRDGYVAYTSLCGEKVQTNKVVFAGNVNFSKEGVLDHWMEGVSTSTGGITVKRGRMIFTTGSWRNASSVTVEGDGTIEIQNREAFAKETPFAFNGASTDGMLVIPSGTTLRFATVTVNGRPLNGTFTSGLVTGGGTLVTGTTGMSIIVR